MGIFSPDGPDLPRRTDQAIIREGKLPGILGDCHASGTEIIEKFGEEHIRTGKPILYTSADLVIQIAAHEQYFGLERLYELCKIVRELADPLNIGRVIARPFVGETRRHFPAHAQTASDFAVRRRRSRPCSTGWSRAARRSSASARSATSSPIAASAKCARAAGNMEMFDKALEAMADAGDGDLVFANFVDFDTEFGHRRDVAGYAAALEAFDRRIPEAIARLKPGDMLILTADHGNDPTWRGTDHTRERIPIFGIAPGLVGGDVGLRVTFADIGETVAEHLGLQPGRHGASFLKTIAGHA